MAVANTPPRSILEQSGIDPVPLGVAGIDESPDSPDANWLTAADDMTNISLRVDFEWVGIVSTALDGTQTFRAHVRKSDALATADPTARIEVWYDGIQYLAGPNTSIGSSTGQTITFEWNAQEIGGTDSTKVQCRVVGTSSGGAPAAQNAVDIGAIEWQYDGTTLSPLEYNNTLAGDSLSGEAESTISAGYDNILADDTGEKTATGTRTASYENTLADDTGTKTAAVDMEAAYSNTLADDTGSKTAEVDLELVYQNTLADDTGSKTAEGVDDIFAYYENILQDDTGDKRATVDLELVYENTLADDRADKRAEVEGGTFHRYPFIEVGIF